MDDEITTKEAAVILGVGPRHVRWYWENGKLPGRMVVDRLLFRRADVEAFVRPKRPGRPKAAGKEQTKRTAPKKRRKGT